MKKIEAIRFSGKDMLSSLYSHSSGDAEKLVSCYVKAPSDSHGLAHVFWVVCGYGDAALLRIRRSTARGLSWPSRWHARSASAYGFLQGRLALWASGGHLVPRRTTARWSVKNRFVASSVKNSGLVQKKT